MAGYSGTPLPSKLGIKQGHVVALLGAPPGFQLDGLPDQVELRAQARGPADVLVLFASAQATLRRRFPAARRAMRDDAGLWVAWPKRASGVPTDLDENVVREFGLDQGLVDNKVCAIDDVWSGLRLVVRLRDRTR